MISEGADSAPRTFRSEFVPRKGARVPVDAQVRVLVGDGQVVGVTSIARDLSERDRLENELRQAQKMEAVGRLATGIAHDFNNLITVLLGYSDELIEEAPPSTTLHAAAVEVRRAADRASGLTQQLLAFSRRQVSVAHAVDLNYVIAHMEDLIRRLLGPEIRLEFSLQPDLADDQRRQPADRPGDDEPGRQRARCDAGWRHADDRDRERRARRRQRRCDSRPARRADRRRFRARHDRRRARSVVRAVLHDQGFRPAAPASACRWCRRSSARAAATSSSTAIPAKGTRFKVYFPRQGDAGGRAGAVAGAAEPRDRARRGRDPARRRRSIGAPPGRVRADAPRLHRARSRGRHARRSRSSVRRRIASTCS